MEKGRFFPTLLLWVVAALFLSGVIELLILRFQEGDVYPPYSSYRSDPLGTKAFYEGLGLLPDVEAVRNVEPLGRGAGLSEATLFFFGIQPSRFLAMPHTTVRAIEDAAREGGRMVISFAPIRTLSSPPSPKKENKGSPPEDDHPKKDEEKELYDKQNDDLSKRWGVQAELGPGENQEAILSAPGKDLPPSLPWLSPLAFVPQDDGWSAIYTRAGKPVLLERSFGKGSIVLSSDSFFLSNEAMKSNRVPRLLSWLCGPHRKIIFDETHLGVTRSPGVATLLRKYGLAPFFASLIILAALGIWKQSSRLVPAYEEEEPSAVGSGQQPSASLTNLLRRNIPPDDILMACLGEWKRSFTHGRQNLSALLPRIQEIIAADRSQPSKQRNPAQVYRQISALVKRR